MQLSRIQNGIQWVWDPPERMLLIRVFQRLLRDYHNPPEQLSTPVRQAWYSSQGCKAAGLSDEDFEEWVRQLHQFRGEYTRAIEGWLISWLQCEKEPLVWCLRPEDTDLFLTLINDYRLAVAAERGITEEWMEASWGEIHDPALRTALAEIHILAAMIEGLLRLGPE